ncbi:MAG: TRAP transporter permease [Pseudorhodoplanes sp.]|uniref:TRAP transporter permease n=1 Tax=Pseudorhodoplanes sp. TaxID=1934341 RepID=UPI003D10703B
MIGKPVEDQDRMAASPPAGPAARILGLALVLLSLAWLTELHRFADLVLFTEQPLALAAGLSMAIAASMLFVPGSYRRTAGTLAGFVLLGLMAFVAWDYPQLSIIASMRPAWLVALSVVVLVGMLALTGRVVGLTIMIVVCLFIGAALIGPWIGLPTIAPDRLAIYLLLDPNGLLGLPLRVALEIVIPFVFFGELLRRTGGGEYMTGLALSGFGRYRGGSAKAAVGASALFGTISGNAVSNVAGTGVVTIPLMKRTGLKPETAGAIEATASTGGQLMPPVMGSAAFIMADMLRVPYAEIMVAALIPALLYYAAIFVQIDRIAARSGIMGLPAADVRRFRAVFLSGAHFLVPFAALFLAFLAFQTRPQIAALMAIGVLVMVTALRAYAGQRISVRALIEAAIETGVQSAPLILITAAAGLLMGLISLTGLGFSLAADAMSVSGGNRFFLLAITAVIAIVFGMGMPTVAVYIMLATVLAPALVDAGVAELPAHLFILYFGMLSMVTPPVALASITAAKIAGADMWRTSWAAVKLAWVAYIVPFLFIYSPALLLRGNWLEVLLAVVTAFVGTAAVSMAIIGYAARPIGIFERVLFALFGIMLMIPPGTDIVTIIVNLIGGGGLLVLLLASRAQRGAASAPSTSLNKEEIA